MYVVSYDIESDRIRNRVSKELMNYGKRVQYSVFECRIDKEKCDILINRLSKLISENEAKCGNIIIYRICKNCESVIHVLGDGSNRNICEDKSVIII